MITDIGITASRHGLSDIQRRVLTAFLHRARIAGATRFHHGCCAGGDEIGAEIAHNLGYRVIGHPPIQPQWKSLRAVELSHELREPKLYLTRDRRIVAEGNVLIGLPNRPEVGRGSGTWFTVNVARQVDRPRLVVLPSGVVVDRVGVDGLHEQVRGEFAARVSTDQRVAVREGMA